MAAGPFLTHTPLEIDRETCGDGETSEVGVIWLQLRLYISLTVNAVRAER